MPHTIGKGTILSLSEVHNHNDIIDPSIDLLVDSHSHYIANIFRGCCDADKESVFNFKANLFIGLSHDPPSGIAYNSQRGGQYAVQNTDIHLFIAMKLKSLKSHPVTRLDSL